MEYENLYRAATKGLYSQIEASQKLQSELAALRTELDKAKAENEALQAENKIIRITNDDYMVKIERLIEHSAAKDRHIAGYERTLGKVADHVIINKKHDPYGSVKMLVGLATAALAGKEKT